MKVIVEGRKDVTAWWVGQRAKCRDCGRTVELERGDDGLSEWFPGNVDREVSIGCPVCRGRMTVKRMLCPNSLLDGRTRTNSGEA